MSKHFTRTFSATAKALEKCFGHPTSELPSPWDEAALKANAPGGPIEQVCRHPSLHTLAETNRISQLIEGQATKITIR